MPRFAREDSMKTPFWVLALCAACSPESSIDAGRDAATRMDGGSLVRRDAARVDAGPGELASSITQYGITWTFDREYATGVFVTGDPWVVGPVTIVSISPAPTGTRNGSAVDPRGLRQGYDDRGGEYDDADNIELPFVLDVDRSLVSSISKPEGVETQNVGCLQSQAVLTAVSAPVPATTFRPAYAGDYKRYFDTAQIAWVLLPDLDRPGSAPDVGELASYLERPRIDHLSSWTIQHSCAEENWNNGPGAHACYGREYSTLVSEAALAVMLDDPDRDALAIRLIQLGIDNYGVLRAGGNWAPNGGHHNARKWPVIFAARMLDDCDMLRVGRDYDDGYFGEDGHTYYGASGTALFGWDCGGGHGTYLEDGCMGGGAKDCRDPEGMIDGCPDYRDCCTSAYWIGQALATYLIDARAVWDHEPYFDYVDRWMAGDVSDDSGGSSDFVDEMWSLYRNDLPTGVPAPMACD
jgi:hypothetical protein